MRYIKIQRCNNAEPLSQNIITILCDQIASQTEADTVIMYDEAGQQLENLSAYIHRLRTDVGTKERARLAKRTSLA